MISKVLRPSLLLAALVLAPGAAAGQERGRATVPVPRLTIYPGDVISDAMLVDGLFRTGPAAAGAVHTSPGTLVGRIARRTLIAGQPIPLEAVRVPFAVQQGQTVVLLLEAEGLSIAAQGEAMQSGASGELISFRNIDTGALIRGRVRDERTAIVEER